MKSLTLAFLAALVSTSAAAQQGQNRIEGGPAQGMLPGEVLSTEGKVNLLSLRPSLPNASPVPAQLRPTLNTLLSSYRSNDFKQASSVLAENAVRRFCPMTDKVVCEPDQIFDGFGLPERDRPNTPYYMSDGRVRLEWLTNGKDVRFLTFLSFTGAKLVQAETVPAIFMAAN